MSDNHEHEFSEGAGKTSFPVLYDSMRRLSQGQAGRNTPGFNLCQLPDSHFDVFTINSMSIM